MKFLDIKKQLNGYGRIIYFTSSDPEYKAENSSLLKVQEGQFKEGLPDGYSRVFNAPAEGSAELGQFSQNQPLDKYVKMTLGGEVIEEGTRDTEQEIRQKCIQALQEIPVLKQYRYESENVRNAEKAYKSKIFGGSVLEPLDDGIAEELQCHNPLQDEINNSDAQPNKGAGFYVLKDIKYAANVIVDIWMMIPSVSSAEMQKVLKEYNGLSHRQRQYKDGLRFLNLKEHLNGWGRIIFFTSNDPDLRPEKSTLIKIQEGSFKNGLPNGFCRIINGAGEGTIEIGYFEDN